MSRIAVLGAGAWGTALALLLSQREDHQVTLWAHTPAHASALHAARQNAKYLPGYPFPAALAVTGELALAVASARIVISAVPSEHTRALIARLAPLLHSQPALVSATKGIEDRTHLRVSEVMAQTMAKVRREQVGGSGPAGSRAVDELSTPPIGVLSGPSFAQELAAGQPAAVTLAFPKIEDAARFQSELACPTLRVYRSDDVVGVELGGALKNVIAIAAGVVAGSGLGHNATAALITRGIAETTRLALACGARRETLAGLSGVGDLVLTCTGALSRNRRVGLELGQGRALGAILADLGGKVAEGIRTTDAALGLAREHGVDMPIATQVAAILNGSRTPREAVQQLMAREARDE